MRRAEADRVAREEREKREAAEAAEMAPRLQSENRRRRAQEEERRQQKAEARRHVLETPPFQPGALKTDEQGLRACMIGVYNYMTLGLGVTGLVAYAAFALGTTDVGNGRLALTDFGHAIYVSPLRWLIVVSPLALLWLSARINSMLVATALSAFIAFAALIGLSMSALLVVFTGASIGPAFFAAATAFASLSLYGYMTQRSLSAMGSFMVMGVIGLIVASLINLFLHSSGLQFGISILAVVIFGGLTAWGTQPTRSVSE
jgi:FtsH-binding integral membrane protein